MDLKMKCQCISSSGIKCIRNASIFDGDDPKYCWQHQGCNRTISDSSFLESEDHNSKKLQSINCAEKYRSFDKDHDKNVLGRCYYPENLSEFSVTTSENPLDGNLSCTLMTTRKVDYYKHDYNPEPILSILRRNTSETGKVYLENVRSIFDLEPRKNCCYCIAISLYAKNNKALIEKYLPSIVKTVENVTKNAPNWIVRLYLDPSVFQAFKDIISKPVDKIPPPDRKVKLSKEYMERRELLDTVQFLENRYSQQDYDNYVTSLLHYLFNAPNVEIYTYFCPEILNESINLGKTRMFRFLPLIDPTVAVCASREADGIVTNLDCHNLEVFSQSNRIFYLIPIHDIPFHHPAGTELMSYSEWLDDYKDFIRPDYFEKYYNLYDLLAGTFTIKLKVKVDMFYHRLDAMKEAMKEAGIEDFAFDEVFLLDLFKDLLSVRYSRDVVEVEISDDEDEMFEANNPRNDDEEDEEEEDREKYEHEPEVVEQLIIKEYDSEGEKIVESMVYGTEVPIIFEKDVETLIKTLKRKRFIKVRKVEMGEMLDKLNNYSSCLNIGTKAVNSILNRQDMCDEFVHLYAIDSILNKENIKTNQIFDAGVHGYYTILSLINEPYADYFVFDHRFISRYDADNYALYKNIM